MKAQADDFPAAPPDAVDLAAQLIAELEGFSPKAYADPPGQTNLHSIGYGHQIRTGDGFNTDSQISEPDALDLLHQDLNSTVKTVNKAVTVDLSPQQLAALYSFAYNVGPGHFQTSTLLKRVNAGDFAGAQEQFAVWNIANGHVNAGLVSRREKEASLFGSATGTTGPDETADA